MLNAIALYADVTLKYLAILSTWHLVKEMSFWSVQAIHTNILHCIILAIRLVARNIIILQLIQRTLSDVLAYIYFQYPTSILLNSFAIGYSHDFQDGYYCTVL